MRRMSRCIWCQKRYTKETYKRYIQKETWCRLKRCCIEWGEWVALYDVKRDIQRDIQKWHAKGDLMSLEALLYWMRRMSCFIWCQKRHTKRHTKETYRKRPDVAGVVAVLNEEDELRYMMSKDTSKRDIKKETWCCLSCYCIEWGEWVALYDVKRDIQRDIHKWHAKRDLLSLELLLYWMKRMCCFIWCQKGPIEMKRDLQKRPLAMKRDI